ncbi:MAG: FIST N-terminal domain-containing protein [Phycisphaerales bacterium]
MQTAIASWDQGRAWPADVGRLDSESTLVLAFGASECVDRPEGLEQLRAAFPRGHVVGCSTSGQIRGDSVRDEGIDALIIRFEHARVRVASSRVDGEGGSLGAGRALGEALHAADLRGVFVLSDGTRSNGTQLCAGLSSVLGAGTPVTGGLAGDGPRFQRTWVCCDSAPCQGLVAAVGLYGDESVAMWHGCKDGWDAFGPERVVTRSCGNVLYELDGEPALGVYERYLGGHAADLPASALLFPLSLRRRGSGSLLVRTVLGVSREEKSMTFAGDIPQGSTVQLMRADFDRIIDGASGAANMLPLDLMSGATAACVPINCVGRRLILKHRAEEELEEVVNLLAPGVPSVGFYSYGEISPLAGSPCELHNQTMTLAVFAEQAGGCDAPDARKAAA